MTTDNEKKKVDLLDKFDEGWYEGFGKVLMERKLTQIAEIVHADRIMHTIYPPKGSDTMFEAFRVTPLTDVRVVVLGQDPYHDGSFNGLAFGNGEPDTPATTKISPSLRNIIKEVERSHPGKVHPSLYPWAQQGVLLINTAHTVRSGDAGSHLHVWVHFTHLVIQALNTKPDIVWMLWGAKAQAYKDSITNDTHAIVETGHPSPLNRTKPMYDSGCFEECNTHLTSKGLVPIKWTGN